MTQWVGNYGSGHYAVSAYNQYGGSARAEKKVDFGTKQLAPALDETRDRR